MGQIRKKYKKVLIAGAHSFIGQSFEEWVHANFPSDIAVNVQDMHGDTWKKKDFSGYDALIHVAGIAHVDVGKISADDKTEYFKVNRDLVIETAKKARKEGVKQFIFLSSILVYGDAASNGHRRRLKPDDIPGPKSIYGESKLQAEKGILELENEEFHVAIVRLPMVYGAGCKGNFPKLERLATKLPFFPNVHNERSVIYIDNLSEFFARLVLYEGKGLYFPQNPEHISTSELIKTIACVKGHNLFVSRLFNFVPFICSCIPGRVSAVCKKAFGSISYEMKMSDCGFAYQLFDLRTSIERMAEK